MLAVPLPGLAQGWNLDTSIPPSAISDPSQLPIWRPPPPERSYIYNSGGKSVSSTPECPISIDPITVPLPQNVTPPDSCLYDPGVPSGQSVIRSGGELYNDRIPYRIVLNNPENAPLREDTMLYIKVGKSITYIPHTTKLNDIRLTDQADSDILSYSKDDNILKVAIGSPNLPPNKVLTFFTRPLEDVILLNGSHCLYKFESKSANYESEWIPLKIAE